MKIEMNEDEAEELSSIFFSICSENPSHIIQLSYKNIQIQNFSISDRNIFFKDKKNFKKFLQGDFFVKEKTEDETIIEAMKVDFDKNLIKISIKNKKIRIINIFETFGGIKKC